MLTVIRLGHRIFRDQRITTHCALVSRAFGADRMYYSGQKDAGLEKAVQKMVAQWGGNFSVEYTDNWKGILNSLKCKIVHLTAYGIPLEKSVGAIRKCRGIAIVIGGEKVPPEIFQLADWNVAVGSQPHSEVAALAIFLDRLNPAWPGKKFAKARLEIQPMERGKSVRKVS
ncbi:MAG: tRNA (cytidine(56)-2'-O)-methyltransferase [Candidatus Aenigmarchaeota archaeon]|nr:tRNA (cytidine(56)-2'-O)-methyltransferase [Candidatus Aenigmarchaeota archaeon]